MLRARLRSWAVPLLGAVLLSTGLAVPASAAPVATAPALPAATTPNADFYRVPAGTGSGRPGQLISSRLVTLQGVPAQYAAWLVMYHSRDALGKDVPVTGTVLVPTTPYVGNGPRPFVTFAPGTQGLGPQCAPSEQLQTPSSDYEASNIGAALDQGWGVVVTDY
jgi:hypothetical protein